MEIESFGQKDIIGLNKSTIRKYIGEQESHNIAIDKLTTKEYTNLFENKKK